MDTKTALINKITQLKNVIFETQEQINKENKKRMCSSKAESLTKHKKEKEIELAVLEEVFDGIIEDETIDFGLGSDEDDKTDTKY